jgi:hypothetical protein
MKFNVVKTVVAVAMSALIAYAYFAFSPWGNGALVSIGSFIENTIILITALGITIEGARTMANLKIVGWLFFLVSLVTNGIFAAINFGQPAYIIINGLILLIFVLVAYSIGKASKE